MAPSYKPISLRSTRMQAVVTAVDADAAPATMEIGTAGMGVVLVTLTLNDPSFTESGGILTLAGVPKTANAVANGKAASARIKDGAGNIVVDGLTVSTAGADINFGNIKFVAGQPVTLSGFTLQHAP